MDRLRLDLAFAVRAFARRPGFTALVVVTFGLGIGATTAMFSVVDAVLLRPLPYPAAERIVAVYPTLPEWRNTQLHATWDRGSFSYPEFIDFKQQQTSFEEVGVYSSTRATLLGGGEPERLQIGVGSPELLPMLGARPRLGRLFSAEERTPVVVLTAGLWQRRFGGAESVLGQKVVLNGESYEVVGVLPAGFEVVGYNVDLWRAAAGHFDERDRNNHNYAALGRLRRDVSIQRASQEAERLIAGFSEGNHVKHGGRVVSRQADLTQAYRLPLIVLICAAFLLLAAACTSVAAMLLGAGLDRETEIAIRAAMGAPRRRIVGQLLTEGALLGAVGGAAGIALAALLMRFLLQLAPAQMPLLNTATLDLRVLGFAILASLLFAVLFTLVPALVVSGANLSASADTSRVTRRLRGRLQFGLVAGEVALATVLLTGSGLLTRTMQQLNAVDPGFDPDGLITVRLSPDYLRLYRVDDPDFIERVSTHFHRIVEEVKAIPGVQVAIARNLPYTSDRAGNNIVPEGYTPAPGEQMNADRRFVSANYFDLMRMRLVAGRGFTPDDDRRGAPRVVVVNESLGRRFWPREGAVGKRIRFWDDLPWTVVGVVRDPRERDLRGDASPTGDTSLKFYAPGMSNGAGDGSLVIRTNRELAQLAPIIRERIWSVDPTVAVTSITTMRELMGESIADQRYRMRLMLAFSVLAAIFAIMGVHGVLSRAALRRRRELGVRAALGALYRDLVALILKQALAITTAGLMAGLFLAYFATRVLESLLYETHRADPVTLIAIGLLMLVLTLLAAWQPARRAARTDPMQALRSD